MGRWVRPEVYPLVAAMTLVTGMVVFQLTRNVCLNPDVRVSKRNRGKNAVPDNAAEGRGTACTASVASSVTAAPEVMPSVNSFFSKTGHIDSDDDDDGDK